VGRLAQLWRTTTVRLTAIFILVFTMFAVLLLGLISYQSSIQIQRQQAEEIEREVVQLQRIDRRNGLRALAIAVELLARQPGPGIYYLGDPLGQRVVGNVDGIPANILQEPGVYSFEYEVPRVDEEGTQTSRQGTAVVRSVILDSGFILVVGRDVVERRGFTAIIFGGFVWGVVGIVLFSLIAGLLTALRVLRRIDAINSTATKIMSGNLAERIPVTGRKDEFDALATSLNLMFDRIESLMQGLKEVTDNVAHDLKTPLTRLRNKADEALRTARTPDELRTALEATIDESDNLIRIFNALLMIARLEAGSAREGLADFDAAEAVRGVAELYDALAEEAGVDLEVAVEDDLPVHGSRELLGQAMSNLLDNALKYGASPDAPSKTISVSAHRRDGEVLIAVADRGPGIPEAERGRVLERFVRLETARSRPGFGLGLSLAAAVARLHGGALRLEDNEPGLRVVLALPLKAVELPQTPLQTAA
jgi:signal transduction histidine kinase